MLPYVRCIFPSFFFFSFPSYFVSFLENFYFFLCYSEYYYIFLFFLCLIVSKYCLLACCIQKDFQTLGSVSPNNEPTLGVLCYCLRWKCCWCYWQCCCHGCCLLVISKVSFKRCLSLAKKGVYKGECVCML